MIEVKAVRALQDPGHRHGPETNRPRRRTQMRGAVDSEQCRRESKERIAILSILSPTSDVYRFFWNCSYKGRRYRLQQQWRMRNPVRVAGTLARATISLTPNSQEYSSTGFARERVKANWRHGGFSKRRSAKHIIKTPSTWRLRVYRNCRIKP